MAFLAKAAMKSKLSPGGGLGGVVSLIAVGVVISAAFATSARRQLATVGQLSANGAPAKVIERSLALQGAWTGFLGAILGVGLGLVAVLAIWGSFEELIGYDLANRRIGWFDLGVIAATATVAATVAALLPAKSAARVPVLTALAGRRPVGAIPKWLVPLGSIATLGGLGLLALVAYESSTNGDTGDIAALVAVVGAVSVMVGLICVSPLLIETAGRIGHAWPGSLLLAVRSLVRQRTRSAAVVSAISVVMALTMAGLTAIGIAQTEGEANTISNRTIKAQNIAQDSAAGVGEAREQPIPQSLVDEVEALVSDAQRIDVKAVPIGQFDDMYWLTATVVTDEMVPLLGLSDDDLAALGQAGLGWPSYTFGEAGEMLVDPATGVDLSAGVSLDQSTGGPFYNSVIWFDFLVTPEWVAERDLDTFTSEVLWVNDVTLNAEQRSGVNALGGGFAGSAFISVLEGHERTSDSATTRELGAASWNVWHTASGDVGFPWGVVKAVALGASLLLVVGVVAIGLGLAAVESRDERAVLHVVGAPPAVLRRVAAAKTWVLTTSAAVVAVPTGFIVVWVIRAASKMEFDQHAGVPWLAAISLILAVPALATVGTWIGSGVASRIRPVTASRMRLD